MNASSGYINRLLPNFSSTGQANLGGTFHLIERWRTQQVPIPHTLQSSVHPDPIKVLGVIPPKPLPGTGGGGGGGTHGYLI
jgi:hypothetical protein